MDLNSIELSEASFNDIQRIMEGTLGDVTLAELNETSFIAYVAQLLKVSYTIGVRDGLEKK